MDATERIELERLERLLLVEDVRRSAERLGALLCEGFREFGSSGRVWQRAEIIAALAGEQRREIQMTAPRVEPLGDNAALLTYASEHGGACQLRSSLLVRREGRWQLLFHQGTPSTPEQIAGLQAG